MAFSLASKLVAEDFAGVLACGAGGTQSILSDSAVLYGLCGSNCFNRWDMALTARRFGNTPQVLRFFRGNHSWAGSELISEAMAWMHRSHLKVALKPKKKAASRKPKLILPSQRSNTPVAETTNPLLEQAGKRIFADIVRYQGSNPERALDWAVYLVDYPCSARLKAEGKKLLDELRQAEKVTLYEQGVAAMNAFVKKHFATDIMAYKNNPNPPAAKEEATVLAAKYADTSLQEVFEGMSRACVNP